MLTHPIATPTDPSPAVKPMLPTHQVFTPWPTVPPPPLPSDTPVPLPVTVDPSEHSLLVKPLLLKPHTPLPLHQCAPPTLLSVTVSPSSHSVLVVPSLPSLVCRDPTPLEPVPPRVPCLVQPSLQVQPALADQDHQVPVNQELVPDQDHQLPHPLTPHTRPDHYPSLQERSQVSSL